MSEGIPGALPGLGPVAESQHRSQGDLGKAGQMGAFRAKQPTLPSLSEDTGWFLLAHSFPASLHLASHHSGFLVVFVFIYLFIYFAALGG